MAKKIFLLLISLVVIGCGSSRPTSSKSKHTTSRTVKRPVAKKPTASRNTKLTSKRQIEEEYRRAKEAGKSTGKTEVYSKQEILEATTKVQVTTPMVHDYINQFSETAKNNMRQHGIPASIILAQGILESGSGTGPLSAIANNHFGIKCHDWTGPSVAYDDDARGECFRKYEDASHSYRDHSIFLTTRSRYASLFSLRKDDYKAWAKGLKAAGYATDPRYPEKLISIIERYQLHQYDLEVLGKDFVLPVYTNPIADTDDYYQVTKGDTLYSISRRFNTTVEELRRKNNLRENAISIGQQLRIK